MLARHLGYVVTYIDKFEEMIDDILGAGVASALMKEPHSKN
ncbi:MAG: hypothetical protein PXY39_03770 [archaeon]|nr:hypothetical protein [archaeon]